MKYELYAPMYILFIRLADYIDIDEVEENLNNFLIENIDIDKGVSKEYILDTLRQAFRNGEACNVKLDTSKKEVVIEKCLDWIGRNREESTGDAEITELKPETNERLMPARKRDKECIIREEQAVNSDLSMRAIAFKCIYEGRQVTEQNYKEVAQEYGIGKAPTSGRKIYQRYTELISTSNRTKDPGTSQMLKRMIKDLESIIPYISTEKTIEAINDLEKLKGWQSRYDKA
ncbi:MAG: hypothetical protein AB7U05_04785 [Mangrovibacterium sp.]